MPFLLDDPSFLIDFPFYFLHLNYTHDNIFTILHRVDKNKSSKINCSKYQSGNRLSLNDPWNVRVLVGPVLGPRLTERSTRTNIRKTVKTNETNNVYVCACAYVWTRQCVFVTSAHTRYNKFQKDEARVGPSPDFEWRWLSKRSIDVEPIIFPI